MKTDNDSPEPRTFKRTLVIYGSKGKSDDLLLSSQSLGYVCFQPGATDEFIVSYCHTETAVTACFRQRTEILL